jgi:hypothetical protein
MLTRDGVQCRRSTRSLRSWCVFVELCVTRSTHTRCLSRHPLIILLGSIPHHLPSSGPPSGPPGGTPVPRADSPPVRADLHHPPRPRLSICSLSRIRNLIILPDPIRIQDRHPPLRRLHLPSATTRLCPPPFHRDRAGISRGAPGRRKGSGGEVDPGQSIALLSPPRRFCRLGLPRPEGSNSRSRWGRGSRWRRLDTDL